MNFLFYLISTRHLRELWPNIKSIYNWGSRLNTRFSHPKMYILFYFVSVLWITPYLINTSGYSSVLIAIYNYLFLNNFDIVFLYWIYIHGKNMLRVLNEIHKININLLKERWEWGKQTLFPVCFLLNLNKDWTCERSIKCCKTCRKEPTNSWLEELGQTNHYR